MSLTLRPDFDFGAYHLLRLEVNARHISFALDDKRIWQGVADAAIERVRLIGATTTATFAGFALTVGYEDLFTDNPRDLAAFGWRGDTDWRVADNALGYDGDGAATITKTIALTDYELVVNASIKNGAGSYGIHPALDADGSGVLCRVAHGADGYRLVAEMGGMAQSFALAADFDPTEYQQFRFRKVGGRLTVEHETAFLGTLTVADIPSRVGLYATGAAAFEMVRVSALLTIGSETQY